MEGRWFESLRGLERPSVAEKRLKVYPDASLLFGKTAIRYVTWKLSSHRSFGRPRQTKGVGRYHGLIRRVGRRCKVSGSGLIQIGS
jgi:hypothetical protein